MPRHPSPAACCFLLLAAACGRESEAEVGATTGAGASGGAASASAGSAGAASAGSGSPGAGGLGGGAGDAGSGFAAQCRACFESTYAMPFAADHCDYPGCFKEAECDADCIASLPRLDGAGLKQCMEACADTGSINQLAGCAICVCITECGYDPDTITVACPSCPSGIGD